ncbi:hypothetical protein DdX_21651 [Ditylenchus destructor]|uniref:Uncharacterized protein n=1 Tax=Ditylenchus destructor TaxID=166010 RepID=A0AAD4MJB8_9BILA|nr:hypothetical protein DdX_21651 [Ditylenchus destructor]
MPLRGEQLGAQGREAQAARAQRRARPEAGVDRACERAPVARGASDADPCVTLGVGQRLGGGRVQACEALSVRGAVCRGGFEAGAVAVEGRTGQPHRGFAALRRDVGDQMAVAVDRRVGQRGAVVGHRAEGDLSAHRLQRQGGCEAARFETGADDDAPGCDQPPSFTQAARACQIAGVSVVRPAAASRSASAGPGFVRPRAAPAGGHAHIAIGPAFQHAGGAPVAAFFEQALEFDPRRADACPREPREQRVVGRHMRCQHADRQRRRTGRGPVGRIEHRHLPAATRKAGSHGGACQARADDGAAARRIDALGHGSRRRTVQAGAKVPHKQSRLGGRAGTLLDDEVLLRQRVADRPRDGPGGDARALAGEARHRLERKDAVGLEALGTQHRLHVAYAQREQHAAIVEGQPMEAGQQAVPLRSQFGGQRSQLRIGARRAQQVGGRDPDGPPPKRSAAAAGVPVGAPRLPGRQEIEAQAEAGFENPPLGLSAPGLRQAAAARKGRGATEPVRRFCVIDVVEALAAGNAVCAPALRHVGAFAEEVLFHLPSQVLAGAQIGQVQPVLVDQHGLLLEPGGPGFLADAFPDPLAQFAGVGREVETFGLFAELDATEPCVPFLLPSEREKVGIREKPGGAGGGLLS